MKFSNILKDLLKEHNLSQEKLANAIGFSQRAVSKWVNEQAEPTETAILRCANFFNISTDELLGKDIFSIKRENAPSALTQEETNLLDTFRSLPRMERVQATEYINYLAEKRGNKNKNA